MAEIVLVTEEFQDNNPISPELLCSEIRVIHVHHFYLIPLGHSLV